MQIVYITSYFIDINDTFSSNKLVFFSIQIVFQVMLNRFNVYTFKYWNLKILGA